MEEPELCSNYWYHGCTNTALSCGHCPDHCTCQPGKLE